MQFSNMANAKAHEKYTAKEIIDATNGNVDIVIAGIGTAGTVVGLKNGFKKLKPEVEVIGVEPASSPLLMGGQAAPHKIQGIGANFITDIYKSCQINGILDISDEDALNEARELAKTHGVCSYERGKGTTLVGGAFSKETLIKTLNKYIPNEFLPEEFRTEDSK